MLTTLVLTATTLALQSPDWPQWGRDPTRNMVAAPQRLVTGLSPGTVDGRTGNIDRATTRHVKWIARLGSESYGNPVVAAGRVFVGTNNDRPRDARITDDRACLYCLDAETGALLWQLAIPKLGTGPVSDWELVGLCSSPTIVGDRAFVVTNRCEVLCLDVRGQADGNQGPFLAEAKYLELPADAELRATDADVLWVTSMINECGSAPHNITSSSALVVGERVFASTSNGIDVDHAEIPAPDAPALISLDARTGRVVGREVTGMSRRALHANWSSPALLETGELRLVVFGGPDGLLYAFAPEEDEDGHLVEAWRVDCNPPEYRARDGKPVPYASRKGPSEILATPVAHDGHVFVAIGRDPDLGVGAGNLVCVNARGEIVWSCAEVGRSSSTVSVHDGLVFAADLAGELRCLDARTGAVHWTHDAYSHIWGSTLVADGRVFVGTEDGFLTILPARSDYEKGAAIEIDFGRAIYSSPIAAGGVLYVATPSHLFAFAPTQ